VEKAKTMCLGRLPAFGSVSVSHSYTHMDGNFATGPDRKEFDSGTRSQQRITPLSACLRVRARGRKREKEIQDSDGVDVKARPSPSRLRQNKAPVSRARGLSRARWTKTSSGFSAMAVQILAASLE
jgi:hypothetical protein